MATAADLTITLPGYRLVERVYSGSKTVVYRAASSAEGELRVVIKLLQQDYPTFNDLLQFRNQYTIAKNLDIPGIVRPLCLENYRHSYALVMEDFGGVSLREHSQKQALSLVEVLNLAWQLCDILHHLHHNRVIHKDIKPANILIHPETKQIKLIDFSISSLLPKETQEIKNPNGLEGTLAYLAPEQTGRMNRAIDYRADFYALGVTLFELLTKQLPFLSNDPMELVHCHIALQPPLVCNINPEIPVVVAKIITKLMAKNAENRYQSALGLKHDLLSCLDQYKETGKIEVFKIGMRDVCDRFLIPEKLYGRNSEVQMLLEAFSRVADGASELMLVAGFSGIGKTAVVNEVHKPIVRQRGYFIKGKFDQFNRNIPFSAFVQAFRDLMGQLLSESDVQLQIWQTKIKEALGDNAQVIIEVIPELERIIGKQPIAPELSANAAQNRFNLLFQKFICVFTTKEHPLVMFLDDLQWADSASLKLMQLLMGESQTGYLLLIGAYRDNEVFPVHPLMLTLDEVGKTGATVNTIMLQPLSKTSLNQLVADTLTCSASLAQPLTELVAQKTQGNPFFATQFLKALHQDRLITFDVQMGHWQCDLTPVRAAALTDDVVEFMAIQLQKLPGETQEVLKLAACIGNSFDLSTLAIVSEQTQFNAAAALWKALQEGLVLPQSEIYKFYAGNEQQDTNAANGENVTYRFLHDRVQQAAYSLIPEESKQLTHLKIGQLLLGHTSETERQARIFEIVNQFNAGIEQISQSTDKLELAQLNLVAGQRALSSVAYEPALRYANIGIDLLGDTAWQTTYDLALALHELAAEVAYLCGNFELMNQRIDDVLQHTLTLLDKVKVYDVKIQSCGAQNNLQEAIDTALSVLKLLDVHFPESFTQADIQYALGETFALWSQKSPASLIELPKMTAAFPLAAIQLLSVILPFAYQIAPNLFILITLKQVELSLKYGNTGFSSDAYACYGFILCSIVGDIEAGFQFGELSLALLSDMPAQQMRAKPLYVVNAIVNHWKQSIHATLDPLLKSYTIALETGDLPVAGWAAYMYGYHSYFVGQELGELISQLTAYSEQLHRIQQEPLKLMNDICCQAAFNLVYETETPWKLSGNYYDEEALLPQHQKTNNYTLIFKCYLQKLILSYLFGNPSEAVGNANLAEQYLDGVIGYLDIPLFYFYASLAQLATLPDGNTEKVNSIQERVAANQQKMEYWATHAPMNYLQKFHLVEAERCRVLGQRHEAMELYDRAISGAKANSYIQEEALANELAAKFYLNWGKEKVASAYMQESYYCYARWGAKAKTDDLEKRYPDLLRPILQPFAQILNPLETLASLAAPNFSIQSSTTTRSSSSSINAALDFAAILKASQALSSTIQIDELLRQLTQIILQNSGGDRCTLILPNSEGEWQLRAIATPEQTELCSEPLDNNPNLAVKLIQYVKNTQEVVVIDDLKTDLPVIGAYLSQQKPNSVLCLPILNQGQLRGILALENRSTSGVFTDSRILILNFLCTQAAISLENARLYQQAQTYAQQLEHSQLQIVQSEKMASLGNLVAGVAHEINNPIGFLNGSINNAKDYIQDLLGHLELYQQHHPNAATPIQDNAEDIDLEFLTEDLPKLLNSMTGATDRIKSISTSLRIFSRADTDYKVSANLHEGLDSTLLILKYRLKANQHRPAIEVIQEYGELPQVDCFPGQLNQVFMNILANAIDMFDEMAQNQSFAYLEANPQKITIRTELISNMVKISIRDNGTGMTEAVKAKIFDHLFTTKGVGKGTGLGLAIAKSIVVEKHGGYLNVNSILGAGTEFIITLPTKA